MDFFSGVMAMAWLRIHAFCNTVEEVEEIEMVTIHQHPKPNYLPWHSTSRKREDSAELSTVAGEQR
jgi:hypothetical protein